MEKSNDNTARGIESCSASALQNLSRGVGTHLDIDINISLLIRLSGERCVTRQPNFVCPFLFLGECQKHWVDARTLARAHKFSSNDQASL